MSKITKDNINTIADAKTAKGIQYVTALEGLSTPDSMSVNDSCL